jgi:hypothetical protein
MFKRIIHDKKGVAEIVGTVLFIIILIFFFTNVYLWHDSAVRERDTLSLQRINSRIEVTAYADGLIVKNVGGYDVALSRLWINRPNAPPQYLNIKDDIDNGNLVLADKKMAFSNVILTGGSVKIPSNYIPDYTDPGITFKIVTTLGTFASDSYEPDKG